MMVLTAGFFASKTIGVDFDPLQAMNNYGMRDEQEKCFALQKGPIGHDRLRTWSEGGKRGRMFIYFVGLILASYVRSVWQKDDVLRKKFSSTEAVLQSISPRLSQQPAKEVPRLSQKWKNSDALSCLILQIEAGTMIPVSFSIIVRRYGTLE